MRRVGPPTALIMLKTCSYLRARKGESEEGFTWDALEPAPEGQAGELIAGSLVRSVLKLRRDQKIGLQQAEQVITF